MRVEVVIAWPHRCERRVLALDEGATVDDAVRLAALGHGDEVAGYAVFGVAVDGRARLHEGDRVELLRPLQADPKDARRRRASGSMGVRR